MTQACNFIKKETLAQVFSCGFRERCKNSFLTEQLWTTSQTDWSLDEVWKITEKHIPNQKWLHLNTLVKSKNSEIASCFNHLSACYLGHKNLSGIISNVLSKTTSNFEIRQTKQTSLKYQFNVMLTVIDFPVPCL